MAELPDNVIAFVAISFVVLAVAYLTQSKLVECFALGFVLGGCIVMMLDAFL